MMPSALSASNDVRTFCEAAASAAAEPAPTLTPAADTPAPPTPMPTPTQADGARALATTAGADGRGRPEREYIGEEVRAAPPPAPTTGCEARARDVLRSSDVYRRVAEPLRAKNEPEALTCEYSMQ